MFCTCAAGRGVLHALRPVSTGARPVCALQGEVLSEADFVVDDLAWYPGPPQYDSAPQPSLAVVLASGR